MKKEEKKEIVRDSITDLLIENNIDIEDDIDSQTLVFEKTPSTITNYQSVSLEQCRMKAENLMNKLLRLYLSEKFISKSEYVQAKMNLDSMTLGNIMNQMEISQRAIDVLMSNIELGDINSKLFDALGNLQRTFIDLVKTQTNYIMTINNEYEKLANDKDTIVTVDSSATATTISSSFKSSNQKDLMRMIRSTIDDKK